MCTVEVNILLKIKRQISFDGIFAYIYEYVLISYYNFDELITEIYFLVSVNLSMDLKHVLDILI